MNPFVAVALATLFTILVRELGWLTGTGAPAAIAVGSAVFWGGGPGGVLLLATFVATSSLLTRRSADRSGAPSGRPAIGRNARQVTANGGCAAAGALLIPVLPETGWAVLTGGLAAAQADTWATEIGAGSPVPPRLITSGQVVAKGTSGGVTALGTAGGIAGASLVAAVAAALGTPGRAAAGAWVGGIVGMFADSFLGATLQGMFHCDTCALDTERPVHACGRPARLMRGLRWMDNDVVNLAATCAGAAATVAWVRLS